MTEQTSSGTFWKWIGIGCGGCFVVGVVLAVSVFWFSRTVMTSVTKGQDDPVALAEQTREVFGFEALPSSYDPSFHINIPFTFRSAILADRPFDEDHGFDGEPDRILGLIWLRWAMTRDKDLDPLLADPPDWVKFSKSFGLRLKAEDRIDGGRIDIDDARIDYESWAGEYRGSAFDLDLDGGLMLWRVTCPGNQRAAGLWFRRTAEKPWSEALQGQELRNLFAGSDPCAAVR